MQAEPQPVAEVQTKGLHLARKADLLRLREGPRDLVARYAGLQEVDRLVHPLARLPVRGALRGGRAPDVEGAVVAGAIAHKRLDDVEEGLVAGADEPVGEVVRVRRAALARNGVDRLDAVRAHLVEPRGRERDDLGFLDAGLQGLGDVLVDAVDHRRRHVEEGQLVDVLHLARLEHHLLAVAHLDPELLQLEEHRRLDHVQAERHIAYSFRVQDRLDLRCRLAEQRDVASYRPAQSEEPRPAVIGVQPGRVKPVVLRSAAEIPDVGVAVAGEERVARELVARPFADDGARRIADIVLIEGEQRAQARGRQRGAHAREAVVVQPPEVDALLEIDLGVTRRLQRPLPVVVRVDVVRPDDFRLGGFFRFGHRLFPGRLFGEREVCHAAA